MVCVGGAVGGRGGGGDGVRRRERKRQRRDHLEPQVLTNIVSAPYCLLFTISLFFCLFVLFSLVLVGFFFNHWGAEHSSHANTQTGTMKERTHHRGFQKPAEAQRCRGGHRSSDDTQQTWLTLLRCMYTLIYWRVEI